MDETKLKRLAITLIVAIAIIMLAKFLLTRTYSNLNKARAAKQSAVIVQPASATPDTTTLPDAAPDDHATEGAASSVENTAL